MCVSRKRVNDDDDDDDDGDYDDEDEDDDENDDVDLELFAIQSGKAIVPTITSGSRLAHTDTHTHGLKEKRQ